MTLSKQSWLPIDSAPKDGRPIWVTGKGRSMRLARWATERWLDHATEEMSFRYLLHIPRDLGFEPTHWQPIPDPLDKD